LARVDYSECHVSDDAVGAYRDTYAAGYYAAQWRLLERPLLERLFVELRAGGARSMLDIACGQGRITLLGARHFDQVQGIDYSPSMLGRATNARQEDASLNGADVRFDVGDVRTYTADHPFDVVTAFRFFLNAEDDLRLEGLRCARRNLAPHGTFITNVHVAASSPLAWFYGVSNAASRWMRKTTSPVRNSLSLSAFKHLLASEGLEAYQVHRYSLLPRVGSLTDPFAERFMASVDRFGKLVPGLNRLSQAFMVCARRV
jgi:SAM-dependent methyltransferase